MVLPLTLNLDVIMHFIYYLQTTKGLVLNAAMPIEGFLL